MFSSKRFTKFWVECNWWVRKDKFGLAEQLKSPENVFSHTVRAEYFSKETGLAGCALGGGARWDVPSLCGLTSLPAEVFHSDPAVAAWADIIREGAVDSRECVCYWPVVSVALDCVCVCAGASIYIPANLSPFGEIRRFEIKIGHPRE